MWSAPGPNTGGYRSRAVERLNPLGCLGGFLLLTLLVVSPGCDRNSRPATAAFDTPSGPPLSLLETVTALREAHARGAYLSMRPRIEPQRREAVIDLLMAMDRLLAANAAARHAVQRAVPDFPIQRVDLGPILADNLELFSKNLEVVRSEENGDEGTVTVQIAGAMPLVHLHFQRSGRHWLYLPGEDPGKLIPLLTQLTTGLERISVSVAGSPQTPESIMREYQLRIAPKLRSVTREVVTGTAGA